MTWTCSRQPKVYSGSMSLCLVLVLLLVGCPLTSQFVAGADFQADWRFSQTVTVPRSGLTRFHLPLETVNVARAGFEDLRLLGPDAKEVPYWLERLTMPAPRTAPAQLVNVRIEEGSTVALLKTGVTQAISRIRLESPAPEFLKPVKVEGSPDQESWTTLVDAQPVFRQRSAAESLAIAIPTGRWPFLRVTLDDRRSRAIPITGALISAEAGPAPDSEPLGVRLEQRVEEPGQTRLSLRFAAANVTLAGLTIETPDPLFTRNVTLSHQQFVDGELREVVLARETILRSAMSTALRGANLTIAAGVTVSSTEAVLTVYNEDNPPLQLSEITARRMPIHLVIHANAPGNYSLLSGNPTCPAPRYDLASLQGRLRDTPLSPITAGALVTNASFRSPTLGMLPVEGAPLDVSGWSFRKPVRVAQDGVQQLELDLAVLANGDPSLRDLRLVRGTNQIPYILEHVPGLRRVVPTVRNVTEPTRATVSRWRLTVPQPRLPITRITFSSTASYFTRSMRLVEERRDERGIAEWYTLASATLSRPMGMGPARLSLPLTTPPESAEWILEIENGDNPPLPVDEFEVWHSTARLLFRSSGTETVFLYYGHRGTDAPRYDLAMAWPQLKNAERVQAELGPEEVLQASRDPALSRRTTTWIFWGVLALVVTVLLAIVARLLPKPHEQG